MPFLALIFPIIIQTFVRVDLMFEEIKKKKKISKKVNIEYADDI